MTKKSIKRLISAFVLLLFRIPPARYFCQELLNQVMRREKNVNHQNCILKFSVPNQLNQYRISTFSTKEPETLQWIDNIPDGSVLWDIGANIGLYSTYAAKARNCRVFAFEPSVFNLELLARNIFLNSLQNQIVIVPVALSDKADWSMFKMSNTEWGGALSTFGESFDQNGNKMNEVFEFQTIGLSMDHVIEYLNLPNPDFIKMDVDGIEHFILRGGPNVLKKVQSVLVEINDDFRDQAEEAAEFLKNAGLSLYKKCDMGAGNQYNQWWIRAN